MASPKIYTYHCICSHLILATTRSLDSLPRRKAPGLDNAYIVPLPPPPKDDDDDDDEDDSEESESEEDEEKPKPSAPAPAADAMDVDAQPEPETAQDKEVEEKEEEGEEYDGKDYTLLLSSVRDRRACIIRRDDGFERRLLWRCGRCRLIFGYQIDDEEDDEEEKTAEEGGGGEDDEGGKKKKKKKNKKGYVYILPGSVLPAEKMGTLEEKDLQILKD